MKNIIKSLSISFSLFTCFPVRRIKWSRGNTRFVLAFFPLAGLIIGAAIYGLAKLCLLLSLSAEVFAALGMILSIILSGGSHIAGFGSSCDGIFTRSSREEKLAVLKDPRAGRMSVVSMVLAAILQFACLTVLYENDRLLLVALLGFVVSRALAALSLINFKYAENSSFARMFRNNSSIPSQTVIICFLILSLIAIMFLNYIPGIALVLAGILSYIYYIYISFRHFGGVTLQTAGFYIILSETFILLSVLLV